MSRMKELLSLVVIVAAALPAMGQTGTPPYQTFAGGPVDVINLGNLNVEFTIPVFNKAGRGVPFNYNLAYDTSVWTPTIVNGVNTWQPSSTNWGWHRDTEPTTGTATYKALMSTCRDPYGGTDVKTQYTWGVYTDAFGTAHGIGAVVIDNPCYQTLGSKTFTLGDGSGSTIYVDAGPNAYVYPKNGGKIVPTLNSSSGAGNATDKNGNFISVSSTGVFTDTLGTTALTITGGAPNPLNFNYTSPANTTVGVHLNYSTYTVRTNFGCTGIAEYGPLNVSLVSSVTLPDGSSYSLNYEPTPGYAGNVTGRLQSITLPTGGTISYSYTGGNNGIICADGSTAGLSRTTPDSATAWTYVRSGSSPAWVTTVTDPTGNQSVYNFEAVSNGTGWYETQRQIYQGALSGGTLLSTVLTCYNGNLTNCTSTAVAFPISRRTITNQLPGGLQSKTDIFYNTYGLVTETDEYGFGSGAPGALARKTLTTYATLGNNIVDRPASVQIQDGSGVTQAETTYSYDQTAVSATTSTPQHNSVTGARGNPTTVNSYKSTTTYLSKTFTYYDTGTVKTSTDVNLASSTYTYGNCGNSFVTAVALPLSLSRTSTWNCSGGVATSSTDENSQTTSVAYTDPYFWRPANKTDPLSNVTSLSYASIIQSEGSLLFNGGNSVVDVVGTRDALGRPHLAQRKESPSSSTYDTVQVDYDSMGRPSRSTLPFAASLGVASASAPGTTTSYDALGRPTQVSDSGGRLVTFTYSGNTVLVTVGPAPVGENTKSILRQYDALGNLTGVCEITSGTGSGACGSVGQSGYWTVYTYDTVGHLIGVTQNAQGASGTQQTRSFVYDMLGRRTSETNPESGTTTYTYDTATGCTGTYNGDLVKRIDAVGNGSCYTYDSLHRLTQVSYSGPYAANTPTKKFVYDSAIVSGQSMANSRSRLAEAYTCTGACTTKITDVGFSYTARREIADVYQSTPNSAGYYHLSATYWAHGGINSLSGLPGLPTLAVPSTGLDGQGRPTTITASSGQSPIMTAASYNLAGQPTSLTFGSGDGDSFAYNTNTNVLTSYQFSVGSTPQTVTGTLSWNANGSLGSLSVVDQLYAGNNQTCNYSHDDLGRISSANCGAAWSQTFGYDPFGNITKAGSSSFQPTYSDANGTTNNRIQTLPGFTPTYDTNGNLTADSLHTYTWDAEGRPVMIDSVSVIYDALGRMVEQNRSGSYTQLVYAPSGALLAVMSGQTLQEARLPLVGGSAAVYLATGLSHYRHPDWLGSSRLSTTTLRSVYSRTDYAPFGEAYGQSGTTESSFTGLDQDSAIGLYDALFREQSPIQGRWISPDPLGFRAVNIAVPQSWNRYSYVANQPLTGTDQLGLLGPRGDAPYALSPPCQSGSATAGCTLFGNDIFDAIAGAPGTYLVLNNYGQLSFGFDYQLYVDSMNLIDEARSWSGVSAVRGPAFPNDNPSTILLSKDYEPDTGRLSMSGFQVLVRDFGGGFTETYGLIPEIRQLLSDGIAFASEYCSSGGAQVCMQNISQNQAAIQGLSRIQQETISVLDDLQNTLGGTLTLEPPR